MGGFWTLFDDGSIALEAINPRLFSKLFWANVGPFLILLNCPPEQEVPDAVEPVCGVLVHVGVYASL